MDANHPLSARDLLNHLTETVEQRVESKAEAQARAIIGEYLPTVDVERIFSAFYPDFIRPIVQSSFKDSVAGLIDTVGSESDLYDKGYLKCSAQATQQFLAELTAPVLGVLANDFGKAIEALINVYEHQKDHDWRRIAKDWEATLSRTDSEILRFALYDYDSRAIMQALKLNDRPEDITKRILSLQQQLLFALMNRLQG